jgi:hypothetical protein
MATSLNIKHGTGKILTEQGQFILKLFIVIVFELDIEILKKSSILNEEGIHLTFS